MIHTKTYPNRMTQRRSGMPIPDWPMFSATQDEERSDESTSNTRSPITDLTQTSRAPCGGGRNQVVTRPETTPLRPFHRRDFQKQCRYLMFL